jgi:glycosyltransferase involved in cell wall biosynthesis
MKDARVSVIIPTYNRPGYLAQAVHSALQQTYAVHEIIVVNDGSNSECYHFINANGDLDPHIRIIHFPENRGVSAARNYGLEETTGEFVVFLDDDDLLHPEMIASNMLYFQQDERTDVVACAQASFYDFPGEETVPDCWGEIPADKIISIQSYEKHPYFEKELSFARIRSCLQVGSCLIKKVSLGALRFPERLKRTEDIYFWWTLATAGVTFQRNLKCYSFRRIHAFGSLSEPGWQMNELLFYQQLLNDQTVRRKCDQVILHLFLARMFIKIKRLEGLRHLLCGTSLLFHRESVQLWPKLFKIFLRKVLAKEQPGKLSEKNIFIRRARSFPC